MTRADTRTTGTLDYAGRVAKVQAQLAAIPSGAPVRLRKRTSNLFRPRVAATATLDADLFDGVLSVDVAARTADVMGMTTYEDLVAATLPHGLMPLVVPQLKTITLGGAVTGMGIESSSFRNGMPHESVLEMDILTGDGRVVTAAPDGEHADLFAGFPNSYGTLGYALRLTIELEPVQPFVHLRHLRFDAVEPAMAALERITADGAYDGERVDFLDGTWFSATECYLSLGNVRRERTGDVGLHRPEHLLPVDPATARGLADRPRLPVALGHRLVLVLPRVRRAAARRCAGCGPRGTAARTSTGS